MQSPNSPFASALKVVLEQRLTLTREAARDLLNHILDVEDFGSATSENQIRVAALLGALAARGETEEELAGFIDALRARSTPIPLTDAEREQIVDTCGTGGDLSGTFNISTAAALVAAAAGATVAKHGNRAVTSRSGSADVLEALGIPVDHTPESAAAALRTHRFAFLSAPAFLPAMRAVMPLRRALNVRTVFNLLGPMLNPAQAPAQVMGVYAPQLVPVVTSTLAALNTRMAFVVHGSGMDEFSISGPNLVGQVIDGQAEIGTVFPEAFGLQVAPIEALAGGGPEANAQILRAIFAGEASPRTDVVLMNAAAVLVTANLAEDFLDATTLARDTIESGKVIRLVEALSKKV